MSEFQPKYLKLDDDTYYVSLAAHALLMKDLSVNQQMVDKKREDSAVDSGDEAQHHNEALLHAIEDMGMQMSIVRSLTSSNARVAIIEPNQQTELVDFGNTVVVQFKGESQNEVFTIMGSIHDNNLDPSRISYKTPLAQAILGKRVGEKARYDVNGEKFELKIVQIRVGEF